jgi:hypothetical protein
VRDNGRERKRRASAGKGNKGWERKDLKGERLERERVWFIWGKGRELKDDEREGRLKRK